MEKLNVRSKSGLCFFILSLAMLFGCKEKMAEGPILEIAPALEKICQLPGVLNESSGLIKIGSNFYSINDKGGANQIYQFNENGTLLKTFLLADGSNADWEDLSLDESGNLYIADSGNNDNDRRDLHLYKVNNTEINGSSNELTSDIISFKYEDQITFPPDKPNRHFDCEAVITLRGDIHLFTKDRSKPFTGITNHYIVDENSHLAIFQNSFPTASESKLGAITGAANSANGKKIALTSNGKCWVFSDFTGTEFFSGTIEEYSFNLNLQIEGIFFGDDCTLYFTDEKSGGEGMNLYRLNICP